LGFYGKIQKNILKIFIKKFVEMKIWATFASRFQREMSSKKRLGA